MIDTLMKEVIEEVNIAQKYKEFCMMEPGESIKYILAVEKQYWLILCIFR